MIADAAESIERNGFHMAQERDKLQSSIMFTSKDNPSKDLTDSFGKLQIPIFLCTAFPGLAANPISFS